MDNLRITLLVIGCIIVLGIYLWEIFGRTPAKKKNDILDAVDELPDIPPTPPLSHHETENYATAEKALASLLTQTRNESMDAHKPTESFSITEPDVPINDTDEDAPLPLDMSVKDYEKELAEDKDYDVFAAIEEDIESQEEVVNEEPEVAEEEAEANTPEANQNSDDLLVLYITSPAHTLFNGLSISKAADEVGMIYGHMNIFHHFGPGKLHSGQPLFSIANMHEPGSFDLGRMADLQTKGIAVFMYSPASIDANVVFELYLNTTQRVAELLGGEVRTADNELLNNASIQSLRDKAAAFSENQ